MAEKNNSLPDKNKKIVTKPIIYGNISRYLGKKRDDDGRTHEWKVFIRPYYRNEDLSFIKRVQFKLHESYANHTRILTEPPFEITETGWGEFDVSMKIIFTDPNEKPITISHLLKLFHCDHDVMMGNKSLVREIYDEMVFIEPSANFHKTLVNSGPVNPGQTLESSGLEQNPMHETDFSLAKKEAYNSISQLTSKVNDAIAIYRDQFKKKTVIMEQLKAFIDDANNRIK